MRGGAGGGVGDGARGLHLRSCGAAPEGCNASRDAYNSATLERGGGALGPAAGTGYGSARAPRPTIGGSLLLLLLRRASELMRLGLGVGFGRRR